MTITVSLGVPEGIVFAADSRMTYHNVASDVRVSSDFSQKLFQLGPRAGAVTYGSAILSNRSINSHIEDLKLELGDEPLPVEEIAKRLGGHFNAIYEQSVANGSFRAVAEDEYAVGFIVGGYDPKDKTGKLFEVYAPKGEHSLLRETTSAPGVSWRGHTRAIARLLNGCDPDIAQVKGYSKTLAKHLQEGGLFYSIDYGSMTLQDGVDFATFLARLTVDTLRFSDGTVARPGESVTCGGEIDVACIEPGRGFGWVQRKQVRGERASGSASRVGET